MAFMDLSYFSAWRYGAERAASLHGRLYGVSGKEASPHAEKYSTSSAILLPQNFGEPHYNNAITIAPKVLASYTPFHIFDFYL